jgi:hypothetical protein
MPRKTNLFGKKGRNRRQRKRYGLGRDKRRRDYEQRGKT